MPLLHCYGRSHIFSVSAFDVMPVFLVIFLFLSSVKIILRTFRQLSATLTFTSRASYRLGRHLNLSLNVVFYIFIQQI